MPEAEVVVAFKAWLSSHTGGYFHPQAVFVPGPQGFAIHSNAALPPDTKLVSCPFSLAITPEVAVKALRSLCIVPTDQKPSWTEKQLICSYICLHWILGDSRSDVLLHAPYFATFPPPAALLTPLHFTSSELEAFKGTNLYGATADRSRALNEQWIQCRQVLAQTNESWGAALTWDRYLSAATYLSSRAFPSTLLSSTPSLASTPNSFPVLLPGIDALNHARGQAVTWLIDEVGPCITSSLKSEFSSHELSVSLVLHNAVFKGQELYNNYGPKPNAELILAYGFSLPKNPDDTIVLRIGGGTSQGKQRQVGRQARGAENLWSELVDFVNEAQANSAEDLQDFELELDSAQMLSDMALRLIARLPDSGETAQQRDMRVEVQHMWTDYLEGQRTILESVVAYAAEKEMQAIAAARALGIEIVMDDAEDSL